MIPCVSRLSDQLFTRGNSSLKQPQRILGPSIVGKYSAQFRHGHNTDDLSLRSFGILPHLEIVDGSKRSFAECARNHEISTICFISRQVAQYRRQVFRVFMIIRIAVV